MTKAEKEAFKKRMAAGRAKAKRNGTAKKRKPAKKKNAAKRKPATKKKNAANRKPATKRKNSTVITSADSMKDAKATLRILTQHLSADQKKQFMVRKAAGGKVEIVRSNPNARKTKKAIGKGFGKQLAAEHVRGKKKAAKAKHRRNSDDGAELFEDFHQRAPRRTVEITQSLRYPEHFAQLGKLIELRAIGDDGNDIAFTGFGSTQVVSTPDGSNIYFLNGDQSIDMAALSITSDKDMVEIGPCNYIAYKTEKGFHDFEPIVYFHEFGEEDDILPVLAYDRLNKALFLLGGNYRVRPEGIVN